MKCEREIEFRGGEEEGNRGWPFIRMAGSENYQLLQLLAQWHGGHSIQDPTLIFPTGKGSESGVWVCVCVWVSWMILTFSLSERSERSQSCHKEWQLLSNYCGSVSLLSSHGLSAPVNECVKFNRVSDPMCVCECIESVCWSCLLQFTKGFKAKSK